MKIIGSFVPSFSMSRQHQFANNSLAKKLNELTVKSAKIVAQTAGMEVDETPSAASSSQNNDIGANAGGSFGQFYTVKIGDTELCVPERYQQLRPIGKGAQGVVCKAFDQVTRQEVAIKKLLQPFQNLLFATRAYRELKLMKMVHHKNIIKVLTAFTPQTSLETFVDFYIVMELCDASLQKVIRMDLGHDRLSFLLYQMLCGVRHLHLAGIIHRDLKPTNIVVTKSCQLKILDFGLARIKSNQFQSQYVETRFYRAPEIILGMNYTEKADTWSLGCIFAELLLCQIMFCGKDSIDQWAKIAEKLGKPDEAFLCRLQPYIRNYVEHLQNERHFIQRPWSQLIPDEHFPSEWTSEDGTVKLTANLARDLLAKMLEIDPDKRIAIDDALKHPYVNLWYEQSEVDAPPPHPYDDTIDETAKTTEQWKALTYQELEYYRSINGAHMNNV